MPHVKPNKQELETNIQASLDTLKDLPEDEMATPDPENPEDKGEDPTPPEEQTPPDKEEETQTTEEDKEETKEEENKPEDKTDYKKRYTDSSREAMKLAEEKKVLNKAVEDAAALADPTEEELQAAYPEWEEMTPIEQRMAKDNLLNKKKFDLIHTATSKTRQADEWNDKVAEFVTDPKVLIANPELEGKQDEFKSFATQPNRRGNDLNTLVLAFVGEQEKLKIHHKGKMFPEGGGGGAAPKPKPDDGKLTAAQGRALMKTDYKKFKQMLKAKMIKNE